MPTAGTLGNKMTSGFICFPPDLAKQIGTTILAFPDQECAVYDPTSGEGDFFWVAHTARRARYFGSEISEERAACSRERWPRATILTSAFESVSLHGNAQLLLTNGPFFLQNGKRAPYRIAVESGAWLQPEGIHVSTVTARSDWDARMVNHWLSWYDRVQVWKFPSRVSPDDETTFEDYTQLLIVGIRRATPTIPDEFERKRLLGYRWKEPKKPDQSGWVGGTPPPEVPTEPLADPYRVPGTRELPRLIARHADERTLLMSLSESGAHLASTWQAATSWPDEDHREVPAMPYTGEAHLAAEIMVGALDGQIVWGPTDGPDAEPHLFSAFVGKEWVKMRVDDELVAKLQEDGVLRVEMRQRMDKPILGVLNLATGRTAYFQGEQVFAFLLPWLPVLASRVIAQRQPRYQLDPADWEIRVLGQFGRDKWLPKATYAGLAVPQLHRVFAMGRLLDAEGKAAIQGSPGTGKTRLAGATAARQGYRWRHRLAQFQQSVQPDWVRGLRRAWVKNPRTLAMLGLEPVYGWRVDGDAARISAIQDEAPHPRIVAYREVATGKLLAPEQAGPKALPVLVSTPLKVTKEYKKEILAAFPQAEVVIIETHRDLPRWLARCATSTHPVVVGILSHSKTRATRREWVETVRERIRMVEKPVLDPPETMLPFLEPLYGHRRGKKRIDGYRIKATGKLLMEPKPESTFFCLDCGGRIEATPGQWDAPDEDEGDEGGEGVPRSPEAAVAEAERRAAMAWETTGLQTPVTSRTWLQHTPRWCKCERTRRNLDRLVAGKKPVRSPLWQKVWTSSTRQKYPALSFARWSAALSALHQQAHQAETEATTSDLVTVVRHQEPLVLQVIEALMQETTRTTLMLDLVALDRPKLTLMRARLDTHRAEMASLLAPLLAQEDPEQREGLDLPGLIDLAVRDLRSLFAVLPQARDQEAEIQARAEDVRTNHAQIVACVQQALRRDRRESLLKHLVELARPLIAWHAPFFRRVCAQAQVSPAPTGHTRKKGTAPTTLGFRLTEIPNGPVLLEEMDRDAVAGYTPEYSEDGSLVAYQLRQKNEVKRRVPLFDRTSKRCIGVAEDGKPVVKEIRFAFVAPPPDSFSPYEYLYDFYRGCVGLAVVDESHNGRGRGTDIARSHHFAMLSAQMRQLTSGTHFGGNIISFYHYWFRFDPRFWRERGYGWNDAQRALADYGVMQEWLREQLVVEKRGEARRGSGKTDMTVTTNKAPGISANLIPALLGSLVYLTTLDVGLHMPPREEIPVGLSMTDPLLRQKEKDAEQQTEEARAALLKALEWQRGLRFRSENAETQDLRSQADEGVELARERVRTARQHEQKTREWVQERDLARAYRSVVGSLEEQAREGSEAARLALSTVPRWFAALPCESPFEVWATPRGDWGEKEEPELVIRTPVLAWDYVYPMERWFQQVTRDELASGRRILFYVEQSKLRNMAKRLAWILQEFDPWILPDKIASEDRQQAILDAVKQGHRVILVSYRKVNEGLNLQSAIDTIIWAELPQNLFYFIQASERAWRLGKEEAVKIYIPYYIGSEAHKQVRRLGESDGAAAAFAGEPVKGGLGQHVGADKTTLARLSAHIEQDAFGEILVMEGGTNALPLGATVHEEGVRDDREEIAANFARRNEALAEELQRGRQWFGVIDTLPERLAAHLAQQHPDVWATLPPLTHLPERGVYTLEQPVVLPLPAMPTTPVAPESSPETSEESPLPVVPPDHEAVRKEPFRLLPTPREPISLQSPKTAPEVSPVPAVPASGPNHPVPDRRSTTVAFGNEEDIRRVRKQRRETASRKTLKPKNPVVVKYIPALIETAPVQPDAPTLVLTSLWDGVLE
jgi:hypothetical protein